MSKRSASRAFHPSISVSFGALAAATAFMLGAADANAQSAAVPADELPALVVEPAAKKKKAPVAKKKSAPASAAAPVAVAAQPPQTATATETAESSASPLYADPGPGVNLDVPNTTGSRLGLTPLETPASVSIISGQTARERGQHTITEAVMQNAPGITIATIPVLGTAFTARGFVGNNSITRLYDGTRLYPGTGGTTSFPFNMWSVERVEVLHGPASILYGDGAIGGAINVVPKKPIVGAQVNEAQVYYDSNNTRRASIDSGGSLTDAVAYRFALSKEGSDGWVDNGDSENFNAYGALRMQVSDDLVLSVSHDYAEREPMQYFGVPYRDGVFDKSIKDKNFNVANSLAEFRDEWTQFKAEWQATDGITVRNVAYRLGSRREFRNVEDYVWDTANNQIDRFGGLHIRQKQNQIGNRLDATVRSNFFGFGNETVVGFDVNKGTFDYANYSAGGIPSVNPFNPSPGLFPNPHTLVPRFESELMQRSFFLEDRLELNRYVTVVGGARWDTTTLTREDLANANNGFESDFNSFNWRAGVVVTPVEGLALYGQYAVGADPLDVPLLDYVKNISNLKQTTGTQYEIGIKQSLFGGAVEWSLAAYEIVKNDMLIRGITPAFTPTLHQIGQQSSRGIEATFGAELGSGWRLDANGALLDAKYDEFAYPEIDWVNFVARMVDYSGKKAIIVPRETANIWLTWAFAPGWQVGGGIQYVGSSYENFANTLERPAYTIANAALQWKPTAAATLDFQVTNLFDKTYASYYRTDPSVSTGNDIQGFVAPPRTFAVSLGYKF
ncbi:TonB-dependent siderophore receptor [Hyphomicrobium sulfonivorans]|uniref:TonB-dependent siderophore receptor n=1 Tax=Hyphomicrobium sulfonivorans TaxID=121290 RepID=UPI00156E8AEB|nr:TonB-dependent siderophore receptor [Hyphomicrobium sulfonivorans]NSL72672.1 TonB-dependent siderophore receptor [Hyphomicrobium sulfonivorans]